MGHSPFLAGSDTHNWRSHLVAVGFRQGALKQSPIVAQKAHTQKAKCWPRLWQNASKVDKDSILFQPSWNLFQCSISSTRSFFGKGSQRPREHSVFCQHHREIYAFSAEKMEEWAIPKLMRLKAMFRIYQRVLSWSHDFVFALRKRWILHWFSPYGEPGKGPHPLCFPVVEEEWFVLGVILPYSPLITAESCPIPYPERNLGFYEVFLIAEWCGLLLIRCHLHTHNVLVLKMSKCPPLLVEVVDTREQHDTENCNGVLFGFQTKDDLQKLFWKQLSSKEDTRATLENVSCTRFSQLCSMGGRRTKIPIVIRRTQRTCPNSHLSKLNQMSLLPFYQEFFFAFGSLFCLQDGTSLLQKEETRALFCNGITPTRMKSDFNKRHVNPFCWSQKAVLDLSSTGNSMSHTSLSQLLNSHFPTFWR